MFLLTLLVCLLMPSFARAATITVSQGQSIQEAVNRAQPGDVVQVGPGVFRQRIDLNGAAERRITVQGTPGQTILDGTGLGNGWMIYGRHVKNMTVRHFEIRNHTGGGIGLFGDSTHVAITDNYVHDNRFVCCQGSGIRVTSRFSPTTNREQGVGVIGTAQHITIARNTIRNMTTGFTGTLADNGTETLTVAGDISQFVIEDNVIDRGQFIGIDMIGKSAAWWGQVPGQRPTPAEPWPRQGIVRRNAVTNLKTGMGGGDVGIYCDGCRDIVIEQNKVDGSSGYCYNISTEEDNFVTSQVILRHNVGINCTSAPFGIGPASSQAHPDRHGDSAHLRVVHNTAIRTKPGGPAFRFQYAGGTQAKNNIGVNVGDPPTPYVWHGVTDAAAAPQVDHNLYWGGNGYFEYRGRASLSLAEHQARSGQETHSRVADPHFTNVTGRDVSVQGGSPALDHGAPLTSTVGAGSGTVVFVQDAHYFSDGYGVVAGDLVRIGAETARVTDVDYATNRLTLERPLTWRAGEDVSYPYTGSAPDLGACEGVGTCPTSQGAAPVLPPTGPPSVPPEAPPPVTPPPVATPPSRPQAACTHYASPSGGGSGTSQSSPFHIADFWPRARPGMVLCLLDGTYTGSHSMIRTPPSFAGTAAQPITIRALHDGKVLINGGTTRSVDLLGSYGVLEGINAQGGDNAVFIIRGNRWVVRRVIAWNNDSQITNGIINIGGQYNTVEDCAAFGRARKMIQVGTGTLGPGYNTLRRCWAQWEHNALGFTGGPTVNLEMGYGQDNVTFENNLGSRSVLHPNAHVREPEPPMTAFRSSHSRLLGSIAYLTPSSVYDTGSLLFVFSDGGSSAQAGHLHPMTGSLFEDIVTYVPPSHPRFGSLPAFRLTSEAPGTRNTARRVLGIAGRPGVCMGNMTCTNVHSGTSMAQALAGTGHSTPWTFAPGICRRYASKPGDTASTLTTQGLWPWPMNQRIIEARRQSGRAPVDVTATIASLLGPIPAQCRSAGGGEEPPPVAALPAPRNLRVLNAE